MLRHVIYSLAPLALVLHSSFALAVPTPQEPGWSVRQVASGFGQNFNGLAYDPVSTDLFVTDYNLETIFRVTLAGVKTPVYSATDIDYDEMAFDPIGRILYFGGVSQTTLRKVTEAGVFVEDVTVPTGYTGTAFAPDGNLYVNYWIPGALARYNPGDDSFTTIAVTDCGMEGLTFDPVGNAYAAGYGCGAIFKVTPGGVISTVGSISGPIGASYGDGSIFVTNTTGTIFRVAPDGSGVTTFADGHTACSGIHFASNGNLYVNDHGSGTLWEYSDVPIGVETLAWSKIKSLYRGATR